MNDRRVFKIQFISVSDMRKQGIFDSMMDVLRDHMKGNYGASWNEEEKYQEFVETDKYLVAMRMDACFPYCKKDILGFCGFRFTTEGDAEVVYCYELQVVSASRGMGVGREMMKVRFTMIW